jgi:hypothetical protein
MPSRSIGALDRRVKKALFVLSSFALIGDERCDHLL